VELHTAPGRGMNYRPLLHWAKRAWINSPGAGRAKLRTEPGFPALSCLRHRPPPIPRLEAFHGACSMIHFSIFPILKWPRDDHVVRLFNAVTSQGTGTAQVGRGSVRAGASIVILPCAVTPFIPGSRRFMAPD
jgi:hypothetical protein